MSAATRYGGFSSNTSSSPRKKVCLTYTLRNQQEPLNRSGVNRVRIDPVNGRLFTAGRDSIIRTWNLNELNSSNENNINTTPSMVLEHHTDWVNDIVVCKEGAYLMSASSDTSLKVWEVARGSCTSTLKPHVDYVQALAYSPCTHTVVSAGLDHDLYLWDINALTNLTTTKNTVTTVPLHGQKESVYSVDINHNGTLVVSGSTEKALKVWDTRTYQKLMKLKGHTDNVRTVLLSPDGTECISGSSDGTVRLWSIGQQRCVETFRLHEGGVWALEVDESFKYFYSGGKDRNVYLTDMTVGTQDNSSVLLFVEDHSVLSLVLDTTSDSLWTSTTGTDVKKWPSVVRELNDNGIIEGTDEGHQLEEGGEEGDDPLITDIDEMPHVHNKPLLIIPGGSTIIDCKILNNKRQVLTKDTTGNVALWDVLHGKLVENLGSVDIEVAANERLEQLFVPNWFSCDIKTGMLSIRLEENDCFSAWVMGNNTNLPNTSDLKLNYGALVLKALFEHWPESYIVKQEERLRQEREEDKRATVVSCETFVETVSTVEECSELGRHLGLSDEVIDTLCNKQNDDTNELPNLYRHMYKYFQDDSLTVESLCNALQSLNYKELALNLEKKLYSKNSSSNKVDTLFFSVLPHTPVVLSEATDCGHTLVRFTSSNASSTHESSLLKTYCPLWISDIVIQNQLPSHPKMSFLLGKDSVSKDKHDRLSAQDILTVRKVIDYLYTKLYDGQKDTTTDRIEVYCQGQLLDPLLDMRTVRHTVWKSGGDMKLSYKIIEATPPPSSEEAPPTNDDNDEQSN